MKKIQLGGRHKTKIKGYALVDDENFKWLNQKKWYYDRGYVKCRKESKKIHMHRLIMNTPKEMETDHINGNSLDNRRSNLRVCTRSQNQWNKKLQKNNISGYKGVSWHKLAKKWQVGIKHNRKSFNLGYFDDKIEAAKTYNQKALELFGEFAYSNKI